MINRIHSLENGRPPLIYPTDSKFTVVSQEGAYYTLLNPIAHTLTDACEWAESQIGGSFVIPTDENNPRYGDEGWYYLVRKV